MGSGSSAFNEIVVQIDEVVATLPLVDRSRLVSLALKETNCAVYIAKCPQLSEWAVKVGAMKPPPLARYVSEDELGVDGANNILQALEIEKTRRILAETLFEQAVERSPFLDHFLSWSEVIVPLVKDLDSPDKVREIASFRVCLVNFAAANSAQEIGQATDALARLLTDDQLAELRGEINACGGFTEIIEQIDAHADALKPPYRARHIPPALTEKGLKGYIESHPPLHAWIHNLSSENIQPLYDQWPAEDQSIEQALRLLDVFLAVRSRGRVYQIWKLLDRRRGRKGAGSAIEILNQAIEELDISEHVRSKETLAVWLSDIVKKGHPTGIYDITHVLTLQELTALKRCIDRLRKRSDREPADLPLSEDDDLIACRFGSGLDPQAKDFLRQELEKLDPRTRLILKLRFRRKWTLKKITKEHCMKPGEASKLIAQTVADLRLRLVERGYLAR